VPKNASLEPVLSPEREPVLAPLRKFYFETAKTSSAGRPQGRGRKVRHDKIANLVEKHSQCDRDANDRKCWLGRTQMGNLYKKVGSSVLPESGVTKLY
jgi:hypothetical protein